LEGGGKELEIRVSLEALILLRKIKRVYLGLERGLGLEDTLFFMPTKNTHNPHCKIDQKTPLQLQTTHHETTSLGQNQQANGEEEEDDNNHK